MRLRRAFLRSWTEASRKKASADRPELSIIRRARRRVSLRSHPPRWLPKFGAGFARERGPLPRALDHAARWRRKQCIARLVWRLARERGRLRSPAFPGKKERSDGLARENGVEDARRAAVGNDGGPAVFIGDAHGFQFCFHAAASAAIAAASKAANGFVERIQFGDQSCAFALGIVGVQAVYIGKQHQQIGVNVRHHQSGEFVVIAEDADAFGTAGGAVELGRGDGVIFVDYGDNAELKQSGERGAKVVVAPRIEKIV